MATLKSPPRSRPTTRTERLAGTRPSLDIGRLDLAGAQTIRVIEAAHAKLRDLLSTHTAIEIDCTATTEADLSLVQLLLAARHSAENSGKTVVLAQPAAGALLDVLSRGGFLDAAAGSATADSEFWLRGAAGQ
jgi:hypothetical protein